MAEIKAFRAIRPDTKYAAQLASVPYDVVNREEAKSLAKDKPLSFLRVIRSEIEFNDSVDPYSDEVYERAKENFLSFLSQGVLIQDEAPALYVYQLQMGQHIQTGVVGCSSVDEYESGLIKIHEKTRPAKEQDRIRHMLSLGAHPGPVFLAYKSSSKINSLIEKEIAESPLYELSAEDGVIHRIWKAKNSSAITKAFRSIDCTYVADGHHRAASACKTRNEMKNRNSSHQGDENYNRFLSVLFPHDQLRILPYNRVVRSTRLTSQEILDKLSSSFVVEENSQPTPRKKGDICMYLDARWYKLSSQVNESPKEDPVEVLDVSILQKKVLQPLFGILDPRTDENVDFIGGIRGTEELVRLVDSGAAVCAFSMYPVSIEELFSIADKGGQMPPKSTWFEPKLRSGFLVHRFDE